MLIFHEIDPGFTKKILWAEEESFNTTGKVDTVD
jgi:hypothetical protein